MNDVNDTFNGPGLFEPGPIAIAMSKRGRPPSAVSQAELEGMRRELKAFKEATREMRERLDRLSYVLRQVASDANVPANVRRLALVERERNGV